MQFSSVSCVLFAFAGPALAHMRMVSPRPAGASTLNNSPLGNSGENTPYDFPCKQRPGVYDPDGASNVYEIGSQQTLAFVGEAVHGGGSCQLSLTTDLQPTNGSMWKVFYSIIGGCPASGAPGNLGGDNDANAIDPWSYQYTIPKDVPAGQYTIAWTWFNDLGNREMYMNCGPLTLTGVGGNAATFNALPDMFVANIPGTPFTTNYGGDLNFPEPGKYVDYHGTAAPIPPLSNGVTVNVPAPTAARSLVQPAYDISQTTIAVQGPLNGVDTAWPSTQQVGTAAALATAPPAPTGQVFVTTSPAAPAPVATPAPAPAPAPRPFPAAQPAPAAAPAPDAAPAPAVAPVPATIPTPATAPVPAAQPAPAPPSAPTSQMTPGVACTPEGLYICLRTSYQVCGSGLWSVVMPLAAGTECTGGGVQSLGIASLGTKHRKRATPFRA